MKSFFLHHFLINIYNVHYIYTQYMYIYAQYIHYIYIMHISQAEPFSKKSLLSPSIKHRNWIFLFVKLKIILFYFNFLRCFRAKQKFVLFHRRYIVNIITSHLIYHGKDINVSVLTSLLQQSNRESRFGETFFIGNKESAKLFFIGNQDSVKLFFIGNQDSVKLFHRESRFGETFLHER